MIRRHRLYSPQAEPSGSLISIDRICTPCTVRDRHTPCTRVRANSERGDRCLNLSTRSAPFPIGQVRFRALEPGNGICVTIQGIRSRLIDCDGTSIEAPVLSIGKAATHAHVLHTVALHTACALGSLKPGVCDRNTNGSLAWQGFHDERVIPAARAIGPDFEQTPHCTRQAGPINLCGPSPAYQYNTREPYHPSTTPHSHTATHVGA